MLPVTKRSLGSDLIGSFMQDIDHTFSQQFRSLVDSFFKPSTMNDLKNKFNNSGFPRLDVFTQGDEYRIEATVPGFNLDEVTVEILNESGVRYAKISGQTKKEEEAKDTNYRMKEIRKSKFSRAVALPEELEGDPDAKMRDGILSLSWKIPKQVSKTETKVIPLQQG